MPDLKVSTRATSTATGLDPAADLLLVTDTSAGASKSAKAAEFMRATLPYLWPVSDFATGSLPPTVPLTRASSGWYCNSSGVLVSAATDEPRFAYDPVTLAPLGLLVESSTTNLLTYSEQFDNAAWVKVQATVTANAAVAPDGATAMDHLVENATNNYHYVRAPSVSYVSGTVYCTSVYAKAGARSWLWIDIPSSAFGSTIRSYFDLTNGVTGIVGVGTSSYIQHVGGGIYRCTMIATATATAAGNSQIGVSNANVNGLHLGDGVSGLYVWGASVVASANLVSYVPTAAATVTRSTDVVTSENPRMLTDQCWVIKARTPAVLNGFSYVVFQTDAGSNNHRCAIYYSNLGTLYLYVVREGVAEVILNAGAVALSTDFAIAVRFADNNFAASLNGGAVVTDTSGIRPMGMTAARVGSAAGSNHWQSTIRHIETRRTATDAEVQLLSS